MKFKYFVNSRKFSWTIVGIGFVFTLIVFSFCHPRFQYILMLAESRIAMGIEFRYFYFRCYS